MFTKEKRNEIYKKALNIYITEVQYYEGGICAAIADIVKKMSVPDYSSVNPYKNIGVYPEIARHKPKDKTNDDYWWSPSLREYKLHRITILEQAIKDTEDE